MSAGVLRNNAVASNTQILPSTRKLQLQKQGFNCVNVTYSEWIFTSESEYYCGFNSSSMDDLVRERCNTTINGELMENNSDDEQLVESTSNLYMSFCIIPQTSTDSVDVKCISSGESVSEEFQYEQLPGGTNLGLVTDCSCEMGAWTCTNSCISSNESVSEEFQWTPLQGGSKVELINECSCEMGVWTCTNNCEDYDSHTVLDANGVNMTVDCDGGVPSATNECEIDQAYKSINQYWYLFYLMGVLMVILSCTLKYMVTRRVFVASIQPLTNQQNQIPEAPMTQALWFEIIVRFMFDIALVNVFILSTSLVSQGGVDGNGDTCDTLSFKFQLVYASAVYVVDVLGDFNALYWGSILGFHAKDYESAKFEGLERVHGYATLLPVAAYVGAGSTWMIEAGYPKPEDAASIAIWVSYSLVFATLLFVILYDLYIRESISRAGAAKGVAGVGFAIIVIVTKGHSHSMAPFGEELVPHLEWED